MRWDLTPEYEAAVTHDLLVRALARIGVIDKQALGILRENFNPIVLGMDLDNIEGIDAILALMKFIDTEIILRG